MKKTYLPGLLTLINLLLLSSCFPADSQSRVEQAVAATFAAETRIARSVQETMAAATPGEGGGVPLPGATDSQLVPTVSVSVDTNCRTGPGSAYPIVGALMVGQTAEVVGRSQNSDNWIIQTPGGSGTCWLWAQYATVSGDTGSLPVVQTPPTPTPAASFTVEYYATSECGGTVYSIFQIVNTGSVTFRSVRVSVLDATISTTTAIGFNSFRHYAVCDLLQELDDLEPGEAGFTANYGPGGWDYDISGHNFTATFTLCELEFGEGVCTVNSVSFGIPSP